MIKANPGDILDDAYPKGNKVLATLVVDPVATSPLVNGTVAIMRNTCPVCGGKVRAGIRAYCVFHDKECNCFYCPNCWLLYERIEIGVLDRDGNFTPYEETQ